MKINDLSILLESNMEVYPNDAKVNIDLIHTYKSHGWQLRNLSLGSHSGSHVDAFSHMHKNMESIDQISLDRFFGISQLLGQNDVFLLILVYYLMRMLILTS